MSAEIIQFGKPNAAPRPAATGPQCIRATTATVINARLRDERKPAWRKANAVTAYWRALMDFCLAVSIATDRGVPEARLHSDFGGFENHWAAVCNYREAVRRQIFTPAPTVEAVLWKRAHLEDAVCAGAKQERMEQVIADDEAFLKAHPTRTPRAAPSAG